MFTLVNGRQLRAPLVVHTTDQIYLGESALAIEEVAPEATKERLLVAFGPRDKVEAHRRSTINGMMA